MRGKVEVAKSLYNDLKNWKLANKVLTEYFSKNPQNDSRKIVVIKVCLLDSLYKTNLKSQIGMANHIYSIASLDSELLEGRSSVVGKVSNYNGKNFISFASKFCHFHNKARYPIYDSYVCIALKKLMGWKNTKMYGDFLEIIKKFISENELEGIPFEDIDKFLWLYGLREKLKTGKKNVNKEVRKLYENRKPEFEKL